MSDRVVEAPLAIGAIGITRRYVWPNKGDLTLTVPIESTWDRRDIDELMDTISHIADREEIKVQLAEKAKALEIAKAQPAQMDKEIDRLRALGATARAAMIAAHEASGKRMVFKETPKQQADLAKITAEIENAERARKSFARDVPMVEWEIACLEAKRDGKPLPAAPQDALLDIVAETLGMAAE